MKSDWRDVLKGIPPDSRIDTHIHTLFSDGADTPRMVIDEAIRANLSGISITDHDSIDGYLQADRLQLPDAFLLLPGVELTSYFKNREYHILGYGFDPYDTELNNYLAVFAKARLERARTIYERLADAGINLSWERITSREARGSIGRMHIAKELIETGACKDIYDAFSSYLSDDSQFVERKYNISVSKAVSLIHSAGGKAVVAHPMTHPKNTQVTPLLLMGVDSLEVFHPSHHAMEEQALCRYARKRGLPLLGGSDYHFSGRPNVYIGARTTEASQLRMLLEV